jgi:hypothetical protein
MQLKKKWQRKFVESMIEKNKSRKRVTLDTPPLTVVAYDWERNLGNPLTQYPDFYIYTLLYMGRVRGSPNRCLVIDREGKSYWPIFANDFFVVEEEVW